jgi:type IV secretory pathway VirB10-like protein
MLTPQTDAVSSQVAARPTTKKQKAAYAVCGCLSLAFIYWLSTVEDKEPIADKSVVAQNGAIGNDFVPVPRPAPPAMPVSMNPPPAPMPPGRPSSMTMPGLPIAIRPPAPPPPPISIFQASSGIKQDSAPIATAAAQAAPSQGGISAVAGSGSDRLDEGLGAGRDGGTVSATMLPDRHLFMTMGTPIPCILAACRT